MNSKSGSLTQILKKRFTCRKFATKSIEKDLLLELAKIVIETAPSADNRQSFRFFFLEKKNYYRIRHNLDQEWALEAPWLVFCISVQDEGWTRPTDLQNYSIVDASIAFDHYLLLLTEYSLGSAWVSSFDSKTIIRGLRLPSNWYIVALSPIGIPLEKPPDTKRVRRQFDEIVLLKSPAIAPFAKNNI